MGAESLRNDLIDAGGKFLEKLDELELCPEGAAWIYDHALNDWRYFVASSFVDSIGKRQVYKLLLDALEVVDTPPELLIFDVYLDSPRGPIFTLLASMFKTGEHARWRFNDCQINDMKFDAILYRLNPTRERSAERKQLSAFKTRVRKILQEA